MMREIDKYNDIINLPHHQSATRPKMSNYDRAAQFSPFAALKGYEDKIDEAARVVDEKIELDESSYKGNKRKAKHSPKKNKRKTYNTIDLFQSGRKKERWRIYYS